MGLSDILEASAKREESVICASFLFAAGQQKSYPIRRPTTKLLAYFDYYQFRGFGFF